MLNPYFNTHKKPSFGVNLKSPKLNFTRDDFFIRIRGYGKNDEWVSEVKKTAEGTASLIREGMPCEEVLKYIASGMKKANYFTTDLNKRFHTGILRTPREGWNSVSEWRGFNLRTCYGEKGNMKYRTYEQRLDEVLKHPIKNPFKDIDLTRPVKGKDAKFLKHANEKYINSMFSHIEKLYNSLVEKYVKKEVKKENLADVNETIAQIRWIMAHATPWERGSDAISNVFMKSLYKAMGIKTIRPTKGISFDLEAFCRNLEDYKKNFSSFFEKMPEIVE